MRQGAKILRVMKYKGTLNLEWADGSECFAEVSVEGEPHEVTGVMIWICRGSLMASGAEFATMWNEEGFEICKYCK